MHLADGLYLSKNELSNVRGHGDLSAARNGAQQAETQLFGVEREEGTTTALVN